MACRHEETLLVQAQHRLQIEQASQKGLGFADPSRALQVRQRVYRDEQAGPRSEAFELGDDLLDPTALFCQLGGPQHLKPEPERRGPRVEDADHSALEAGSGGLRLSQRPR